ncbi:hypothetical protein F4825DRAFT_451078 [Nemania diffusa]|nr:hypothetical protein F4825DRAFT_451078 [Nemania diffusa]
MSFTQPCGVKRGWHIPSHLAQCGQCREFRHRSILENTAVAQETAADNALEIGIGHSVRSRILSLSPRLHNPALRSIIRQQARNQVVDTGRIVVPRHVTIQIDGLNAPVRTDQTPDQTRIRSSRFSRRSNKRSSDSFDDFEPAQYYVPEQHRSFQPPVFEGLNSQAGADFSAATSEAIRFRVQTTLAERSPSAVTTNELSMPGAWPSWADEPDDINQPNVMPAPEAPPADVHANVAGNARVGLLGFLAGFAVGAFRTAVWRPIRFVLHAQPTPQAEQPAQPAQAAQRAPALQPVQPAQVAHPELQAQSAQSSNATGVAIEDNGSRTAKRPRFGREPGYQQPPLRTSPSHHHASSARFGPYRSLGSRGAYSRPAGRTVFTHNRYDRNFNHAGHFSLDAMDDSSDGEDDEYPGSPMDIDSPEPVVLLQSETVLARQPIVPGHTQSHLGSNEQVPVAMNQTQATLARQPVSPLNFENRLKLDPAAAAARRAVKLFPKDSMMAKARAAPSLGGNASTKMPFIETPTPVTPAAASTSTDAPTSRKAEKAPAKLAVSPTSTDAHIFRKAEKTPEKARYDDVLEFFPNDVVHSLPGLGDEHLSMNARKVELLKRELMERLRQEEIESQNTALRLVGLRRPNSTLISSLPDGWASRALDAPKNGTFNPRAVHPDAVELKPRDFAKLVPQTAWLNDDCVHSTLCCLAAYINAKAGVKPKVDAPKCVAVSSLYWNAFCDDYKKLYPRPFGRKWNMTADNFLDIDTILIPVNLHAHWTLIVIRPSRRTVSYVDSFHHRNEAQLRYAYKWLGLFLGDKFVADDWDTQEFASPRQTNAFDCGMFVITNAMCLALGVSPMCYHEDKMPLQRRWIAAMLLNGGFHGEFDLGHL